VWTELRRLLDPKAARGAPHAPAPGVPEADGFSPPLAPHPGRRIGPGLERIRHPTCRLPIVHPAIDLAPVADNEPVLATAAGLVVFAAEDENGDGRPDSWGGVVIEHRVRGEPVWSQYGHVDAIAVRVGELVRREQPIAVVGAVGGAAREPVLHFEIRTAFHPEPRNGAFWSCRAFASRRVVRTWYRDPLAFVRDHAAG
jgi:murein DD-endopeptidase MepM/ murein hydrolase activator NlpD